MRHVVQALVCVLLWLSAASAHADGFLGSFTPQAQPSSPPNPTCHSSCSCDGGNTRSAPHTSAGDPVFLKDGSLYLSYTDFTVGVVHPIRLTRVYDSKTEYDSAVGYGWAFLHDQRLFEYPDGSVIIRSGCGRRDKFVFSGGAFVTQQGGAQGQLQQNSDGSYTFRHRHGESDRYDQDGRLIARIARSGARQEFLYDPRGKLPLVGTSPRALNPNTPMVVAYQPRLLKIQERGADGNLTGYSISFTYNETTGRLTTATANDGRKLTYSHDVSGSATKGNLQTVSGLTDYAQSFAYADPNDAHNITTITNGTGSQAVVNTYDTSDRVTKQVQGGSTLDFAYPSAGVTQLTETVRSATGSVLQTRVSTREWNAAGYLVKHTGPDGHELRYSYDASNQLTRTELWEKNGTTLALLKATDTTFSSAGLKLTESTTLDSGEVVSTAWSYDNGWVQSEQTTSTASPQVFRTEYTFVRDALSVPIAIATVRKKKDDGTFAVTGYNYCSATDAAAATSTCPDTSLIKSIDGPRTDVLDITLFSYYGTTSVAGCGQATGDCFRRGDLQSVVNPLGQATTFLRYDGAGRPLQIRDANSVVADLVYHARGWLMQSSVRGPNDAITSDDAITTYQVDARGNLTQITSPDGTTATMTYDSRDRLTKVGDQAGNEIRYTIDSKGNRSKDEAYDTGNTQRRLQSATYDKWDRLSQVAGSTATQTTSFTYDAAGRRVKTVDAKLVEVVETYDDLDRLIKVVADAKTGGLQAQSTFAYDAIGNLRSVVDPKSLTTSYAYDALSRLTQVSSPDTGQTTYGYDDAGNRTSMTDARMVSSNYTFDALNRPKTVSFPNTTENVSYTYDTATAACAIDETFAIGRLTKITDESGTTEYCYDRFGNTVRKVQTTGGRAFTVRYTYTLASQLKTLTYPDGAVVDYQRDSQSRIREIGTALVGGSRQVLLTSATYYPAGQASGWTYGNGRVMTRTYDKDYRASTIKDAGVGGLDIGLRYDSAGYLTELTNAALAATPRVRFGYDNLGRLTTTKDGPTNAALNTYTYDKVGNRTSQAVGAAAAQTYNYVIKKHQLSSVGGVARTYDNSGNLLSIAGTAREFGYSNAGRMNIAKQAGVVRATYEYNGLGEQVRRIIPAASTTFIYDERGQLLGQYDGTGTPLHQYVWMDKMPVGVIAGAQVDYVEADHLGTPRAIIDPVRQIAIWSNDLAGEVFGNAAPNTDPDGDGAAFVYDLRFAGQRHDAASGLSYNYFRDYEPATGRYAQSDPIGLGGGLSTYAFGVSSPVSYGDPFGLASWPGDQGYDNTDPSYHVWEEVNAICSVSSRGCSVAEVTKVARSYSYPSKNGAASTPGFEDGRPVVVYGAQPFDKNIQPNDMTIPGGRVRQECLAQGTVVRNFTLRDHAFYPGMITRVVVNSGGRVWMVTHGVGINRATPLPFLNNRLAALNDSRGPLLFRALDGQVKGAWQNTHGP